MRGRSQQKRARSFIKPTVALVLVAALSVCTLGQNAFQAIPPDEAARYQLNFARNFFASPAAEKANRAELYDTVKKLEVLKGSVGGSAEWLHSALKLYDEVQVQLHRHYSYLYLRYAVDTRDENSLAESSALEADVNKHTAFLRNELLQISPQTIAKYVKQKPQLK